MTDRKLQQVPLASYNYRHEAEFAAGFLRDAGIRFRLQIEDPALGLSAVNGATIWVAAMDEGQARRVLDHDMAIVDVDEEAEEEDETGEDYEAQVASAHDVWARDTDVEASRLEAGSTLQGAAPPAEARINDLETKPDLTLRQRLFSLVGCVGVASTLSLEAIRQTPWGLWPVVVLAVVLAAAGVLGRAPAPVRGILEALSGDAP